VESIMVIKETKQWKSKKTAEHIFQS